MVGKQGGLPPGGSKCGELQDSGWVGRNVDTGPVNSKQVPVETKRLQVQCIQTTQWFIGIINTHSSFQLSVVKHVD